MSLLDPPGCNPVNEVAYEVGSYIFRRAKTSDDAALRGILRNNGMDSWVQLSLEREPSYFSAESLMGTSTTVIAEQHDAVRTKIGMYSCSAMPVHVEGRPSRALYIGGLRINPAFRRRIRILRGGFESIRHVVPQANEEPVWFTSIAAENTAARRMLEAKLRGLPQYEPRGELVTLALSSQRGKAQGLLRPAEARDIPAMLELFNSYAKSYQYSAVLTSDWLHTLNGSNGLQLSDFLVAGDHTRLTSMAALWDQRKFKQTVARGYRFPLGLLRHGYNAISAISGGISLPPVGKPLEQIYMAFAAFSDSSAVTGVVSESLWHIRKRGAAVGVIGLSSSNPVLAKIKAEFRSHAYRTCIESVAWPDQSNAVSNLLPPQPEVAIL